MSKPITCPFCFETFSVETTQFRYVNVKCVHRAPDAVYADFQGSLASQPMGAVFSISITGVKRLMGQVVTSAACPYCQHKTYKRICPRCHYELSQDAGSVEERIITVIGAQGSGKSNYIATLINRLENEVGAHFNAGVMAKGDTTRDRYYRDFYTPLYRNKKVVPPTQPANVGSRIKVPMVFRMTFGDTRKTVNLVFFDTAGEDMQSLDTMVGEAKYILFADAIILLLDPLQVDAVREQLPPTMLPPRDPGANPQEIVQRVWKLYERYYRLSPGEKVKKPVAITLSKIDTLFQIINPESGLHHAGEHFGYLNLKDINAINKEVSTYLHSWMGPSFTGAIDANFSKYIFCGISALGKMPDVDQIDGVAPIRVEDPLLWILSQFGVIKTQV